MAAKRRTQHLGTLDAQVDATVLDARDRGLRNAAQGGQLRLAESLQLANDPYRFARRHVHTFLGWTEIAHVSVSDSHVK